MQYSIDPTVRKAEIIHQVQCGAQFLDTAVPDWFHPSCATPIVLADLDMNSFTHCILGHLCSFPTTAPPVSGRSWLSRAANRLSLPYINWEWAAVHGLYPGFLGATAVPGPDWNVIAQSAWIAEIIARRTQVATNAANVANAITNHE